jgi:hypothetical protein
MLVTPASRYRCSTASSSRTVWPYAVRCAIGVVTSSISTTMSWVRPRVEPPAPYVIETNEGPSHARLRMAARSFSSPSGVWGGKNSNDAVGRSASRSWMRVTARSWSRPAGERGTPDSATHLRRYRRARSGCCAGGPRVRTGRHPGSRRAAARQPRPRRVRRGERTLGCSPARPPPGRLPPARRCGAACR